MFQKTFTQGTWSLLVLALAVTALIFGAVVFGIRIYVDSGDRIPLQAIAFPATATPTPTATSTPVALSPVSAATSVPTATLTEVPPTLTAVPQYVYSPSFAVVCRCGWTQCILTQSCPPDRPFWRQVVYCYGACTGGCSGCTWDCGGMCNATITWCIASCGGADSRDCDR